MYREREIYSIYESLFLSDTYIDICFMLYVCIHTHTHTHTHTYIIICS